VAHLQGEGRTVFYSSHLLYEVEPLADEVAILHQGRILRQADTETLRRDVRQLMLSRESWERVRDDIPALDLEWDGEEAAVTVQNAEAARALLERRGVRYRETGLNLDEIFTAYVAGKAAGPPEPLKNAAVVVAGDAEMTEVTEETLP
jgi:ABC-2 type transport system ATP-binding protein